MIGIGHRPADTCRAHKAHLGRVRARKPIYADVDRRWALDRHGAIRYLSVTAVTKAQATAIGAAIEEAAPGTRQIDLEGL